MSLAYNGPFIKALRPYQLSFRDATSVVIPGNWHGLQTTTIIITIYVYTPEQGWRPLHDFQSCIDPTTYDVMIDFTSLSLDPCDIDSVIEHRLPPQNGFVRLMSPTLPPVSSGIHLPFLAQPRSS
jgi:hypothetical protein